MSLVRLNIKGISYSQTQNGAYALILSEENGDLKLPIVIGAFEAQSIAIALEKEIMPPRPLTHDLFKTFAKQYDIAVKQVIIHKLLDGVFYSSIICEREGIEEIIDARTSDAIALALRFDAPIFTYKNILDKAGIKSETTPNKNDLSKKAAIVIEQLLTSDNKGSVISAREDFSKYSLKQLKKMLKEAVNNEEYEKAVSIRDEVSKRQ
ncbi:MAG: bifunctional nuclease family protein [Flavobacteriaceae bacterium]|nr:bifunctional nuclease family protein [Flavobacteriaceae bacterium]